MTHLQKKKNKQIKKRRFSAKGDDLQTRGWKSEIQGLMPNTTYLFRISPVNEVGTGASVQSLSVFKTVAPPKKPMNLRSYIVAAAPGATTTTRAVLRFDMQDLLLDAPCLACSVELTASKSKKKLKFASRNYILKKSEEGLLTTTWELADVKCGAYAVVICGMN